MTIRAGVRGAGGAFSLVVHLILLALVLAWRPLAGWVPPAETQLSVELEPPPPPPPPSVELEEPRGGAKAAAPAAPPRAEPRAALDSSRYVLPAPTPAPAAAGLPLPQPGAGAADGQASGGSGGGASGSGSGAESGRGSAPVERLTLVDPSWVVMPTRWDMLEVDPPRALALHVSGGATLACLVDARKRARDCIVLRESPADYGFGAAALRLSALFRIRPPVVNGRPRYDVRVRVPVYFENVK